jgi:hypothetical protein
MIWEYLILAALLAWALFYLWRTFFAKRGCGCGQCPSAPEGGCPAQRLVDQATADNTGPDVACDCRQGRINGNEKP